MNHQFLPEGRRMDTLENRKFTSGFQGLQDAMCQGRILEGRAVRCDAAHDLFVDFGFCQGVIPHEEAAAGLADGSTREIRFNHRLSAEDIRIILAGGMLNC